MSGIVSEGLSGRGRPLDARTRELAGPLFAADFSRVRIHSDCAAAASARTLGARAYTVGNDIVFGANEFAPHTPAGRSMLAHELVHVRQQRDVAGRSREGLRLGAPDDRAEREAASAHPPREVAPLAQPVVQRLPVPVPTWAGTFSVTEFDRTQTPSGGGVSNGAEIRIAFTPGDVVDATKIGFVQAVRTMKDGKPYSIFERDPSDRKALEVAKSRSIPKGKPGEGTHVDVMPASRTPLAGVKESRGADLSDPVPNETWTHIGAHYHDGGKLEHEDALLHDIPSVQLDEDEHVDVEQSFETSALAIAGKQSGLYYGSVSWGWHMGAGDFTPQLRPFKAVSADAPSGVFNDAAVLWNASKSTGGETALTLPIGMRMTTVKKTELFSDPRNGQSLGKLEAGTKLEMTDFDEATDPSGRTERNWRRAAVLGGALKGKVGYVDVSAVVAEDAQPKKK